MVEEVRNIIPNHDELLDALDSYRRKTPDFLPSGRIVECKQGSPDTVGVRVEADGVMKDHTLDLQDLLEPLIRFCLENNIKLPRKSKKTVKLKDKRITLHIHIEDSIGEAISLSSGQW